MKSDRLYLDLGSLPRMRKRLEMVATQSSEFLILLAKLFRKQSIFRYLNRTAFPWRIRRYQNYSQGEWQVAKNLLTKTLSMRGEKAGAVVADPSLSQPALPSKTYKASQTSPPGPIANVEGLVQSQSLKLLIFCGKRNRSKSAALRVVGLQPTGLKSVGTFQGFALGIMGLGI